MDRPTSGVATGRRFISSGSVEACCAGINGRGARRSVAGPWSVLPTMMKSPVSAPDGSRATSDWSDGLGVCRATAGCTARERTCCRSPAIAVVVSASTYCSSVRTEGSVIFARRSTSCVWMLSARESSSRPSSSAPPRSSPSKRASSSSALTTGPELLRCACSRSGCSGCTRAEGSCSGCTRAEGSGGGAGRAVRSSRCVESPSTWRSAESILVAILAM